LRNARDQQYEQINTVSTSDLAQSKRALERKALEYERLKRGLGDDLTDEQREDVLVDFESKFLEEDTNGVEEDFSFSEVKDEFGRTRIVKQARQPRVPEDSLKPYPLLITNLRI
jgi:hypothetical protein